jgi:hypothetical protein
MKTPLLILGLLVSLARLCGSNVPGSSLFEAEAAAFGKSAKIVDGTASGGYLVRLAKTGESIRFAGLPAAGRIAIRYASTQVGTISVAVNDAQVRKVNIHSSGASTGSFLHAGIDLEIPANATLTISRGRRRSGIATRHLESSSSAGGRRAVFCGLAVDESALHGASVVARGEVRGVVTLGSAVHARAR